MGLPLIIYHYIKVCYNPIYFLHLIFLLLLIF